MTALVMAQPMATLAQSGQLQAKRYANCTALQRVYPHGVGKVGARDRVTSGTPVTNFYRSDALYAANKGSDRDGDKVACEKR